MSRLKPRLGTYENALAAYGAGEFSHVVELLSEDNSAAALALRARAFIRLGDATAALASLNFQKHAECAHELAAEILAIRVFVLYLLHRSDEAAALSIEARARCFSSGSVAIEAELIFASAMGALLEDDEVSAEALARSIFDLVEDAPPWLTTRSYRLSLNFWRFRACEVLGALEHSRANHVAQASWFKRAFDEFDSASVRDDFYEAALLANYSDAAIGLGLVGIVEFVNDRSKRINWTPALFTSEFRVFSALAEASSLEGDQLGALRYFRRCLNCAPNAALQIRASVERARLLSEIGEAFSAREELDHAVRLSKAVDWENVGLLEQRQLVFLAAQVASYSGPEANRLMSRYDGLTGSRSANTVIKDERFRGEEFAARAAIMRANGQTDRAIILLLDALEIWTTANYEVKAAFAAAELSELTKESHYIAIAHRQCAKQPHSILARKVARWEFKQGA